MNVVKRREKLFSELNDNSLAVFFSGEEKHQTQDQYYHFEVSRNFYYLTNINVEKQILVLHKGVNNSCYLFIEENTELKAKWDGARMPKEEASKLSGIDVKNIFYLESFEQFIRTLMGVSRRSSRPAEFMYLDLLRFRGTENVDAHNYAKQVKDEYFELQIKNIEPVISKHRMYKDETEVAKIQTAVDITEIAIYNMWKNAEVGNYEYQVESHFLQSLKYQKSSEAFTTICASGINGTVLHYHDNDSEVKDDTLVLTDLGGAYKKYNADITRTWPINGKFTARQKEYYSIVLEANKKAIEAVKPGVTWAELNKLTQDILFEGLKALGKVEERTELSKYYYHGVGHFLGLDVHDVGIYSEPLTEGMILTIEPGLYIADEEIGIRIEDNVLVTKDGNKNLSKSIIKEIDDIEEFMS